MVVPASHSRSKDGVASLAYGRSKDGVASLAYGPRRRSAGVEPMRSLWLTAAVVAALASVSDGGSSAREASPGVGRVTIPVARASAAPLGANPVIPPPGGAAARGRAGEPAARAEASLAAARAAEASLAEAGHAEAGLPQAQSPRHHRPSDATGIERDATGIEREPAGPCDPAIRAGPYRGACKP